MSEQQSGDGVHARRRGSLRKRAGVALATAALLGGAAAVVTAQPTPAGATPAAAAAVALTTADVTAWLDGYLPYAMRTGDLAAAVVVVVKDGQIVTERGYGYADLDKRTPVDPKLTLFRPGSVSKLLTWTAVMQQVEHGKIDLDADVNKYLDFKIPDYQGKPVTMRNLMQHTAGFEEQAKEIISDKAGGPDFVALLKAWVPERIFAPGTTPAYSNYGASLAGYIVQRVSGESFDSYIDKHILAPLEMTHSSFRQPLPPPLAPLMAQGHRLASEEPKPFEFIGPAPAGSLAASGEDMGHFMIAQLQGGEYHGKRILEAQTAETMHNSPLTLLPPLNRMELGFFETNVNGREVIGHLGDTEYFHTSLHLFPKENAGFYVSFDGVGKDGAAGTLRTAMFQDFADRYFPNLEAPDGRVDAKTAAEHGALISGTWLNSRRSQSSFLAAIGFLEQISLEFDAKKGELVTPFPGPNGKPRRWVEVAPFLWRDVDGKDRLAAQVLEGKAVRFSFDFLSPFMVFERVPWYANVAWLRPLLLASMAALLLTALAWPVTAIIRRSYSARLSLAPKDLRVYRLSKLAAIAILAALLCWGVIFMMILKDTGNLSSRLDPLIWLAEILGTLAFIGGAVAMLWNLRSVWRGGRRWPAKVWSIVLTVSAVTVLWTAVAFRLVSLGVHY